MQSVSRVHSYSDLDGYCEFGLPAISFDLGTIGVTLPRVSSSKLDLRNSNLDEVVRAFGKVFQVVGNSMEIMTTHLIRACRAHLQLMRSGGAALSLVAKDLESNLCKVEQLHRKNPKCKTLVSLLELERNSDIHDGNVLQENSAAMGLLWIRRSLTFQCALFDSLVPSNGKHPKQAAQDAYSSALAPFHGWMLRTVFQASLQLPNRTTFLSKFGEVDIQDLDEDTERKVANKLRALVSTLAPLLAKWTEHFEELNFEDTRKV